MFWQTPKASLIYHTMMTVSIWAGIGFVLGAIPFSVWLGRLLINTDIRQFGDGNPGATNAWRAGGWSVGLPVLLLDVLKGMIPVSLANFVGGVSNWELVPVALAPILGHAFSPLLRFQGGKAIAVTFGVWSGLMGVEGPLILGLLMAILLAVVNNNDRAAILGLLAFGVYLLFRQMDFVMLTIWGGNMLILLWKYRYDLGLFILS